jgi:NAD(P)-dependent dehydrogenase (short-subunit alcohol dehydrogenase family)
MNKHVLVTGAGSGIGLEVSKRLLADGYTPLLVGRNLEKLKVASKHLEDAMYLSSDLSTPSCFDDIRKFISDVTDLNLVGLVNNAGAIKYGSFEKANSSDFEFHFKTNVMSAIYCTKAVLSELKKTKGSIVNISSTLGLKPIENTSGYSVSKSAMNCLTQSLALELSSYKIRVNALCPGIVNTPIHKETQSQFEDWSGALKSAQPLGRVGEPNDVASAVSFFISDTSSWITGTLLPVDGGILLNG